MTVCLGAVVAVSVDSFEGAEEPSSFAVTASAESATDRVTLVHERGEAIAVTEIDVVVVVEGEPLARQPPVPFFAADGFRGGPTGPFNARADPLWRVGEVAGFRLASTNEPTIDPGDEVVVRIVEDDRRIGRATTTAE